MALAATDVAAPPRPRTCMQQLRTRSSGPRARGKMPARDPNFANNPQTNAIHTDFPVNSIVLSSSKSPYWHSYYWPFP